MQAIRLEILYKAMCIVNFVAVFPVAFLLLPPQAEAQEKVIPFALSIFGLIGVMFYEILIPVGLFRESKGMPWNPDNWRTIYLFQTIIVILLTIVRNEWIMLGTFISYLIGCGIAIYVTKRRNAEVQQCRNVESARLILRLV